MSEPVMPKDNLAQVLSRINTLTKQYENEIPLLTEVFEGDIANDDDRIPTLSQVVDDAQAIKAVQRTVEQILTELQPLIQSAVQAAVKVELKQSQIVLSPKLEAQLFAELRKRLSQVD